MAVVSILFSKTLNRYYTGSCNELGGRIEQHISKHFRKSFTAKSDDWNLFFLNNNLQYQQARLIESHIKRMKSRKYIENLKKYPDIMERLIHKYA